MAQDSKHAGYQEQREVLRQTPVEGLWGELIRRCVAGEYPDGWPTSTLNMILDLPEGLNVRAAESALRQVRELAGEAIHMRGLEHPDDIDRAKRAAVVSVLDLLLILDSAREHPDCREEWRP